MVLRKYAVDIKDSIYSDFTTIISDWKLSDEFVIQQNYIRCKKTGSYVRFRGLDDSEKIKGLSGFKRVVLEEISQFEEKDLKQIRKRLRGKAGQQIVGIFNPIDETHWIKTKIFDLEELKEVETDIAGMWVNDQGNVLVLKTNYLDNKYIVGDWKKDELGNYAVDAEGKLIQIGGFIDQHTIDDFEKDKLNDFEYYRIYGLGDWGRIRIGGEFWKKFKHADHINQIGWDKELPISLTWDENVNPYVTCAVWQLKDKHAQQIDEIFLEDPRNTVKDVCAEFLKRYPIDQVKGLFIYGDRTSLKADTKLAKGENFFTIITKYLKDYHPTLRLQSKNPSVAQSGKFINEIYEGASASGITIGINSKCKLSVFDYTYALEDSDGTMLKSKKKNPITKVNYEEFGHASDAKRYLITTAFETQYNQFLNMKKTNLSVLSGVR